MSIIGSNGFYSGQLFLKIQSSTKPADYERLVVNVQNAGILCPAIFPLIWK